MLDALQLWQRYQKYLCVCPGLGVRLDTSRMFFTPDDLNRLTPLFDKAVGQMTKLESGRIANPDENRMVGHYWLRAAELAPSDEIRAQIKDAIDSIRDFARRVHQREIIPPGAARFTDLLLVGIGGSALGPQLVADALGGKRDKLKFHLIDNTDPDGIDRTLAQLGTRLKSTLVVVISKSGGTSETRNGMLETKQAFDRADLAFAPQAVAVTGEGSRLDQQAKEENWLARFPMWDWVGGRTSVTSAVGLVPMALQGLDTAAFLSGAAAMDRITRDDNLQNNPAGMLAVMWYLATDGKGSRDMVMLPYKDRLLLLSRYLQQLVMESLGKELDLDGNVVHQGISVFGNKGSTDQHAYVQQLRDGVANFFVNFMVVLQDREPAAARKAQDVEPNVTSGDYLNGFWQGTRAALYEKQRPSVTITCDKLDAKTLGALIALYERTVGFYADMININAYHQPGVEAGKKAAGKVLEIQGKIIAHLRDHPDPADVDQIAQGIGMPEQVETVYHVLEHLSANRRHVARSRNRFRKR